MQKIKIDPDVKRFARYQSVINILLTKDSFNKIDTAINRKDLEQIDIDVPPLAEQYEIVRRVEALFKLADTIEKRVAMVTARVEKLTQSILAKAFRGELVPTEADLARREGRSYESASELLAQIESDRESKQASHKVRSNRVQRKTV